MRTYTVNSFAEVPIAVQQAVNDVVQELSASKQHYDDILRDQIPWLEKIHQEYFNAARGPDGASWPPLAKSTVRKKGHSTILVDTRALIGSLTGSGSGAVRQVTSGILEFGTGIPYSKYHQQERVRKNRVRSQGNVRPLGKTKAIMSVRRLKKKAAKAQRRGIVGAAIAGLARFARKLGRSLAGGRLPPRPHVGLGDVDVDQLANNIADGVINTVKW